MEWGQNIIFRDSLQFLPAFLEQLAASLAKVCRGYFQNLHEVVTDVYPETDVDLLDRKGVFCNDYLDFLAWLDEPALPPREAFFNKLEGVECSQMDYTHRSARLGKLQLPESQIVHGALPSERHMPVGRRVPVVLKQLFGRVPVRPGLLCECAATRVKCTPQTY